ncbi:MAG: PilZ domain-containing protein [Burkholderiales bacterium]|nr:PilZ domain-containing protein [Burkholderiales bacterium]
MKRSLRSSLRKGLHELLRAGFACLPRAQRFALYRTMVQCDPAPDRRLELKIADTREELEGCFRILHDAYVAAGFMQPDPSGMRVTIYHALPTTTTLCAKVDGRVVGTMSLIRDGVFGFPLQSAFDLTSVRARPGQIAEISALAVAPEFRKTGGWILFPLMKFMYEYCTQYFDTRHLVIAVNPNKVELYESLLFFERLAEATVREYGFANGAPAVGATLDLADAPERFRAVYGRRADARNLHKYFVETQLENICQPIRRYHTTNDPVMTPELIDHFFNQRTAVFSQLDERKRALLRSIYDQPAYAAALPPVKAEADALPAVRRHQRFSLRCPGLLRAGGAPVAMRIVEVSQEGLRAELDRPLPSNSRGRLQVELGHGAHSTLEVELVRHAGQLGDKALCGFRVLRADEAWRQCVTALERGRTHRDLAPPVAVPRPVVCDPVEAEGLAYA